jgi:hypothetical protein
MLHARLRVVDKHAGIDAAETAFPFQKKCQIFSVRFRFYLQETGQTLFIE